MKEKTGALVLAAGKGTRMQMEVPKQFYLVNGIPLFIYSVRKLARCVDLVVLVTNEEDIEKCESYLHMFDLEEKCIVTSGGKERFDSSYRGLQVLEHQGKFEYVLIHDAARAMVSEEMILRVISEMKKFGTAVAAVPSKDTIKIADENGNVISTPDRRNLWAIQTPQAFHLPEIMEAYRAMYASDRPRGMIMDDAMVMELFTDRTVHLTMGEYGNVKITTQEDLKYLGSLSEE